LNDGRKDLLLEATAKWREKEVDEDEGHPGPWECGHAAMADESTPTGDHGEWQWRWFVLA
jgi:hypothetical protein